MAVRSRDFVGIAEGIKSYELSTENKVERLGERMSELSDRKSMLEGQISYLAAALAAAYEDIDEYGNPDYERISALESQLEAAENESSVVEQQLDTTESELECSQNELENILEEKAQTLFEIQERARTTSKNITLAGKMFGAYAGVGSTLQSSMQTSLSALSQAASILGGSVSGSGLDGTGNSTSGSGNSASVAGGISQGNLSTSPLAAFVGGTAGTDVPTVRPSAAQFSSSQLECSTPGMLPNFPTGQTKIDTQSPQNFESKQGTNKYAIHAFHATSGEDDVLDISKSVKRFSTDQTSSKVENQILVTPASSEIGQEDDSLNHTFFDWIDPANYPKDGKYIGKNKTWGYKPYGENLNKYSSHVSTLEIRILNEYMSSRGYGQFDFSQYSKDPIWQKLHKEAYPSLHVPLMEKSGRVSAWNKTPHLHTGVDRNVENNTSVASHAHREYVCYGDVDKATKYVSDVTRLASAKAKSLAESVIAFSSGLCFRN